MDARRRITPKQAKVLDALTEGEGTAADVAERTGLTVNTVRTHLQMILFRTGFHSSVKVAVWWVTTGRDAFMGEQEEARAQDR